MRQADEEEEKVLLKRDEDEGKGGRVKKTDVEDGSGYGMRQNTQKDANCPPLWTMRSRPSSPNLDGPWYTRFARNSSLPPTHHMIVWLTVLQLVKEDLDLGLGRSPPQREKMKRISGLAEALVASG